MENHVVQPVVAVDQRDGLLTFWDVRGKPLNQRFHVGHVFRFRGSVLLGPTTDLPGVVVAGFAIIGQSYFIDVNRVERSQHAVHFVIDGGSLGRVDLGNSRVPKNTPLQMLHDIKHGPDNVVVFAECDRFRDRDIGRPQRV